MVQHVVAHPDRCGGAGPDDRRRPQMAPRRTVRQLARPYPGASSSYVAPVDDEAFPW